MNLKIKKKNKTVYKSQPGWEKKFKSPVFYKFH